VEQKEGRLPQRLAESLEQNYLRSGKTLFIPNQPLDAEKRVASILTGKKARLG
jgi:hypothetical protein